MSKLLETLGIEKVEDTTQILQFHAMINFFLALKNVTMYQVFESRIDDENDPHYKEDMDLAKRCDWSIETYISHCNNRQQKYLLNFILNYKGISIQKVKENYFSKV